LHDSLAKQGRAAWPDIVIPDDVFFAFAKTRLGSAANVDEPPAALNAADLYLACGCTSGEPRAVKILSEAFLGAVASEVARAQGGNTEELRSALGEHLLARHPGEEPRIASYTGRGSLRAWLQVVATRLAISLARRPTPQPASDAAIARLAGPSDPALEMLKTKYRAEFAEAFAHAFAALSPRDRNLLRQHYLDGLTGDALAALYRVHRATAVRWLAAARQELFAATRDALMERLHAPDVEFNSILRLIRSELRVSLSALGGP
jgi:RNA polymerase sigma-70 factor (ECF subfamily)